MVSFVLFFFSSALFILRQENDVGAIIYKRSGLDGQWCSKFEMKIRSSRDWNSILAFSTHTNIQLVVRRARAHTHTKQPGRANSPRAKSNWNKKPRKKINWTQSGQYALYQVKRRFITYLSVSRSRSRQENKESTSKNLKWLSPSDETLAKK